MTNSSKKMESLQKFHQGLSVRHLLMNMVRNLYDKEKDGQVGEFYNDNNDQALMIKRKTLQSIFKNEDLYSVDFFFTKEWTSAINWFLGFEAC